MFDFKKAQEYELKYHMQWILGAYDDTVAALKKGQPYQHSDEFFLDSHELMDEFFDTVKNKTCLEVSPGICGALQFWRRRLNGELIAIDPLLPAFENRLEEMGWNWFEGITIFPEIAETFLPELKKKIDGFIFWRNGITHYEYPYLAIEIVSRYAVKGCRLFFWSEIKHSHPPDEGHRDITDNPKEIEDCITAQGWRLLYYTKPGIFNQLGIEFGGVFEFTGQQ